MDERRKQPHGIVWYAVWIVLALVVAYPLSWGPALFLYHSVSEWQIATMASRGANIEAVWARFIIAPYDPLEALRQRLPDHVVTTVDVYLDWWVDAAWTPR